MHLVLDAPFSVYVYVLQLTCIVFLSSSVSRGGTGGGRHFSFLFPPLPSAAPAILSTARRVRPILSRVSKDTKIYLVFSRVCRFNSVVVVVVVSHIRSFLVSSACGHKIKRLRRSSGRRKVGSPPTRHKPHVPRPEGCTST